MRRLPLVALLLLLGAATACFAGDSAGVDSVSVKAIEKLSIVEIVGIISGIITIGSFIIPKIRNFFYFIFKRLFNKIYVIICIVCRWFKIIFTINELEARIAKLEPDENNTGLKETSKKNTEVKKMPTLKQKLDSQGYAIGWEEVPNEDMM